VKEGDRYSEMCMCGVKEEETDTVREMCGVKVEINIVGQVC